MRTIRGVSVFVKRGKKFLAVKREKEDEIFGGMWALPGGQIESGESVLQTAKREIKEETGLILTSLEQSSRLKGKLNVSGYPQILITVYRGEVSGDELLPQDAEIEKASWIGPEVFLKSLRNNNYPLKEIKKLKNFLISEKLLKQDKL